MTEKEVREMLSRSLHRTPENLRKRAHYLDLLGRLHAEQGEYADAEYAYRDCIETMRATPAPTPRPSPTASSSSRASSTA